MATSLSFFSVTKDKTAKEAINKVRKRLFTMVKNNNLQVTSSIVFVTCYKSCHRADILAETPSVVEIYYRS